MKREAKPCLAETPLGLRTEERGWLLGNTSNMPGKESPRFSGLIRPQADVYKLLKWDLKRNLFIRCQIKLSPAQLLLKEEDFLFKPGRRWGSISNFVNV